MQTTCQAFPGELFIPQILKEELSTLIETGSQWEVNKVMTYPITDTVSNQWIKVKCGEEIRKKNSSKSQEKHPFLDI